MVETNETKQSEETKDERLARIRREISIDVRRANHQRILHGARFKDIKPYRAS